MLAIRCALREEHRQPAGSYIKPIWFPADKPHNWLADGHAATLTAPCMPPEFA